VDARVDPAQAGRGERQVEQLLAGRAGERGQGDGPLVERERAVAVHRGARHARQPALGAETGLTGDAGVTAVAGDTGETGDAGVTADCGVTGEAGVTADCGVTGEAGVTADCGVTAVAGVAGVTAVAGVRAVTLVTTDELAVRVGSAAPGLGAAALGVAAGVAASVDAAEPLVGALLVGLSVPLGDGVGPAADAAEVSVPPATARTPSVPETIQTLRGSAFMVSSWCPWRSRPPHVLVGPPSSARMRPEGEPDETSLIRAGSLP